METPQALAILRSTHIYMRRMQKNRLSEYAIQVAILKGVYKPTFILKGGKNVERCANFEAKCAPVKHIRICVLKGD